MSASSNNTANSVSDQLQVVVQHHSATARADSRAQEKTVSKIRQSEAVYIQNHATISAFPEDAQMTKTNQPFATPDRHSTAARIQTETHNNNTTTDSIQSEVPYNQPSFREPEAYLEIPARVSKQRPRLYCICRRPEGDAAMIECSNGDWCSIGWYHTLCVDMTDLPGLGDNWFCQRCQERRVGRLAEPGVRGTKKPAPLVLFDPNSQHRADPVSSTFEVLLGPNRDATSPVAPLPASTAHAVATLTYIGAEGRKFWSEEEQAAVQILMKQTTAEGKKGEKRYEEIARRLAEQYGFEGRTGASVRGHWHRAGRAASGVGEEDVNKGSMLTGVAKASEKARVKKRAEEAEKDDGKGGEELAEEK